MENKLLNTQKELLQTNQSFPFTVTTALPEYVAGNWKSLFFMLHQISILQAPINLLLNSNQKSIQLNLDENEWKILKELVELLNPIYKIAKLMLDYNYPSISIVFPFIKGNR